MTIQSVNKAVDVFVVLFFVIVVLFLVYSAYTDGYQASITEHQHLSPYFQSVTLGSGLNSFSLINEIN